MNLLEALGWTVFHSIWEGAAMALLLLIALPLFRSSRVRYPLACAALLASCVAFAVTFARLMPRPVILVFRPAAALRAAAGELLGSPIPAPQSEWSALPAAWTGIFWIADVVVFQAWTLAGWLVSLRMRFHRVVPTGPNWQARLEELARRIGVRRAVRLLESAAASAPVMMGHLRPVILLPLGLLANLPASQIESILLHELAHIRRHDYLMNLLQTIVESLLFYHPAVWWISSVIRSQRENCCDDLTVAVHGDRREYALALTALEEYRWATASPALAATGGHLGRRIRRILGYRDAPNVRPSIAATIILTAGVLALGAWQTPIHVLPAQAGGPATWTPWQHWVYEDVAYIIRDDESATFRSLRTDAEREHFIEQFWLRRDPTPGTPENEYKEEHYRRIAYVSVHYGSNAESLPGWKSDRGRIYITFGPPEELDSHPSAGTAQQPDGQFVTTYPYETWRYRHLDGLGDDVTIEFVDQKLTGEYRMAAIPAQGHAR